jgi:hypothetical protein
VCLVTFLVHVTNPAQGTRVSESQEFSSSFTVSRRSQEGFGDFTSDIIKYVGKEKDPRWLDEEPGKLPHPCAKR